MLKIQITSSCVLLLPNVYILGTIYACEKLYVMKVNKCKLRPYLSETYLKALLGSNSSHFFQTSTQWFKQRDVTHLEVNRPGT